MFKEDKAARQALEEEFIREKTFSPIGRAHVGTITFDKEGIGYFGYKWVSKQELYERRYRVYFADGKKIHMSILDCLFRRDIWKSPELSRHTKLAYRRAKLGKKYLEIWRFINKYHAQDTKSNWLVALRSGRIE